MIRTYLGVGLVTLATLLLELLLTRIFSVTLYYHFAFMVISLALFGLGLSGVMLYLKQRSLPERDLSALLARYSRRFAVTTVIALIYVVNHSLSGTIDALTPGRFAWQHFFQLSFLYLFATVPFYFGGMVVSLALFHLRERVATIYFFDLVGASLACLLLDPLLRGLGAPDAVLLVSLMAAGAALMFGTDLRRWRPERSSAWLSGLLLALLLANLGLGVIVVGNTKFVERRFLAFSKYNAMSRIEVQEVPKQPPSLTIDAMARTHIYSLDEEALKPFSEQDKINALAYMARKGNPSKVLIIGPGGGTDVLAAMENGHKDITLAEINPVILYDVMLGEYHEYSGKLYSQPGVKPHLAEGRSFVRRTTDRFDIIQATLVDTWAASAAGTFSLSENHLYTVEAFDDYLSKLRPGGLVSMSRWVRIRDMEFVRLCALARTALDNRGVKAPGAHVFATSRMRAGNLLIKLDPFTEAELDTLHALVEEHDLSLIYSPRGEHLNPAAVVLSSPDVQAFYKKFPIDVRPVYDERPFFFYGVKPERLWHALFSGELLSLNSFSVVVLAALLGLVTVLVLCGIMVPLWLGKRQALAGASFSKLRDLAYFLAIGTGFILVEIALLHRFTLHLGHPIHSLRVVLFAILLASGVGSLLSGRARSPGAVFKLQMAAGAAVMVLVVIYAFSLGPLLGATIGWSLSGRVALAAGLVALPGLFMGMMLPSAIRIIARRHQEIIPWAWGLNGAASVFGSVLAMVVAIHLGFTTTLLAGAGAYLVAVLAALRRPPEAAADPEE